MFLPLALGCASPDDDSGAGTAPGDDTGGTTVDPDPVDAGPWDPGVTTHTFTDARGKALTVEIWYPAVAEAGEAPDPYPELPIAMSAFRDAAPATDGPFRLVAFTHGHVAIRYQSAFLMEHLASHGFVVVAPDHPYDTILDAQPSKLWQVVLERPGDLMASVDEVLRLSAAGDPLLGGLVDDEQYAVMGHSLGSITSLSVGGGQVDFETFNAFCAAAEAADEDYEGCGRVENVDPDEAAAHSWTDPRAVVTVPMSPGLWYAFGEDGEGLSTVRSPLVLAGDQDDLLDYDQEERPVWEAMGSPKTLATVETAGHYAFSDICVILPVWDECGGEEDGYIDMDLAKEITRGLVTAWVEAELRGEDEQRVWLDAWIQDYPLVVMESE